MGTVKLQELIEHETAALANLLVTAISRSYGIESHFLRTDSHLCSFSCAFALANDRFGTIFVLGAKFALKTKVVLNLGSFYANVRVHECT